MMHVGVPNRTPPLMFRMPREVRGGRGVPCCVGEGPVLPKQSSGFRGLGGG